MVGCLMRSSVAVSFVDNYAKMALSCNCIAKNRVRSKCLSGSRVERGILALAIDRSTFAACELVIDADFQCMNAQPNWEVARLGLLTSMGAVVNFLSLCPVQAVTFCRWRSPQGMPANPHPATIRVARDPVSMLRRWPLPISWLAFAIALGRTALARS